MRRKQIVLIIFLSLSLCCKGRLFSQEEPAQERVLSLKEIDQLIDETSYNEALLELTRYLSAYPNDFDRAQKRISRIMKIREEYNKGAESLVDIIKNGDETKAEKLTKITELEGFESDPSEITVEFTNLARRTVTLGEVLLQYNRIMREGVALVRKESYEAAAIKFEEGFAIKNEFSDLVFDTGDIENGAEGKLVVYENDITSPVKSAINSVKSLVSGGIVTGGLQSRIDDCEKAYEEYMHALSQKNNTEAVRNALQKVNDAFGKYADLRNKILAQSQILEKADKLANERNPLLMGTSYITFQQKFILGDESNPDTGIIGAFDAYFNRRVESMKSKTHTLVFDTLNSLIKRLPENKIYSLAKKIEPEQKNVASAKDFAQFSVALHNLYALEKSIDGSTVLEKHSAHSSSISFVSEYISDLALAYDSVVRLAGEKAQKEKIDKNDLRSAVFESNLAKLNRYEKIKADSKKYLSLIDDELEKEKAYFDKKAQRQREIEELIEMSGGKISLSEFNRRNTAGVQISDDPLDFRKQIDYFTSVNNQNLNEASAGARILWAYVAHAYAVYAQNSYNEFEKRCSSADLLLTGEKSSASADEFDSDFIKKYPVEAKADAEKINADIAVKKQELQSQRSYLSGGEEYRLLEKDFDSGTLALDKVIKDFDSLVARNNDLIAKAEIEIRKYEAALADAYEQYDAAIAAFKKENFDNANAAVDSASEKFAQALDIEYSEKIRSMREVTLNDLAVRIQQAEYEKVLREVFALKDKATTYYYSSNFDAAENTLVSAQTKWAKVSTEPDSEIEDLLNIVKTVKSVSFGRVLLQSDPHYPELSYSLDMAKQNFDRGSELKKNGDAQKASEAFNAALTNIRNVQNVYPLNKEARLIALKIQRELDPEGFPRQFENQYNAAKMNSNKNEQLADLEDLYEINPKYPGLAQEIYNLKDSLGLFPKKTVQKDVRKSADSKIAEARRAFKAAGNDESKLNQALRLVNEAISIDGTNKVAKELKLDIQLKIGATATAILSQSDEKMYAEAARLFNLRRFDEAKQLMDKLLTGNAAKRSRKVIDLYNRLLKRL